MKIPFDGDPVVTPEDEGEEFSWAEWDDEPQPQFEYIQPNATRAPIPAVNVKVLVFDLFGTIFVSISGTV